MAENHTTCPAEVDVKVVVIHGRKFKGGKQIKHLITEFGVANYPVYSAGVLGVEDKSLEHLFVECRLRPLSELQTTSIYIVGQRSYSRL
jgi:hypothetical protein